MEFLKKLKRFKEAVVEVVKEDPETAFIVVSSGAALGIAICCFIDIHKVDKEIKEVGKAVNNVFAVAQAGYVANNQCCSNLRAQVNYISKHLGIAEECEKVGAETATKIFKESGLTELDASKIVYLLERSKPVMVEFLEQMQTF